MKTCADSTQRCGQRLGRAHAPVEHVRQQGDREEEQTKQAGLGEGDRPATAEHGAVDLLADDGQRGQGGEQQRQPSLQHERAGGHRDGDQDAQPAGDAAGGVHERGVDEDVGEDGELDLTDPRRAAQ
ncbi:hypothetical protein [Allochromatium tepidum]|uniref:hypothetical protein n=1 Tax=Allochromatium tepidum TaxID=553982 RepID=UPI001BCA9E7D|nr:hypothetical protein [Allochromatium tepidum]